LLLCVAGFGNFRSTPNEGKPMKLLVNLKQFFTASIIFAAVLTIHVNVTGSIAKYEEFAKKETHKQELENDQFAFNTVQLNTEVRLVK
jgi:hypothetical protein